MIGSTCFGHCYAHHQELTTIVLITKWAVRFAAGWKLGAGRLDKFPGCKLQPGHLFSLPAPNFQPTATQEADGPFGNQHYSRELLMMGITVPETCWAYHKYNKTISGIYLVLILPLSQRCTVQHTLNFQFCVIRWIFKTFFFYFFCGFVSSTSVTFIFICYLCLCVVLLLLLAILLLDQHGNKQELK